MHEIICKVEPSGNDFAFKNYKVDNSQVIAVLNDNPLSLDAVVQGDKKFGLLRPKDGKTYKYYIKNSDDLLSLKNVRVAVRRALFRWALHLKMRYAPAKNEQEADLIFDFRTESEDPLLDKNTLAYMYYPLGGVNNGHCVINKRFFWNLSGAPVSMFYIDPIHYPDITKAPVQGLSHDLDMVLGHELGHGIFGLQHYQGMMNTNYGIMEEFADEFDIFRASLKVEKRGTLDNKIKRFTNYMKSAFDRDW